VNASDAVVGKAGYSTLAEVYYAGVPFGYMSRVMFRESHILAAYITQHMYGLPMAEALLYNGGWRSAVEKLLALPRLTLRDTQGADQVARFACDVLERQT
jgi:UDP-N-acetylglucosamine:LPS N-acetylglucosamine transferase